MASEKIKNWRWGRKRGLNARVRMVKVDGLSDLHEEIIGYDSNTADEKMVGLWKRFGTLHKGMIPGRPPVAR